MGAIGEEDANKHPDLYRIEIMYIDLLSGIRIMREQGCIDDFWGDVVLNNAKCLAKKLPDIIKALEEDKIP